MRRPHGINELPPTTDTGLSPTVTVESKKNVPDWPFEPSLTPMSSHLVAFKQSCAYQWDPDLPPLGKGDLDMTPVRSNTNTSFV